MPFGWWRERRLRRLRAQLAPETVAAVWARIPCLAPLDAAQADALQTLALRFLVTKRIEPAAGCALDDAMALTIALQACLPILELGLSWFDDWYAVILYPDEFVTPHERLGEDGVVWSGEEIKSGESWDQGPIILSWADVAAGLREEPDAPGAEPWTGDYNVVIHEVAHKLDQRSGEANGAPPLHRGMDATDWNRTMNRAYRDLCRAVDAGADTVLDPYAAESPAEFFAVASETFFMQPSALASADPEVYRQLCAFYRQDPLGFRA